MLIRTPLPHGNYPQLTLAPVTSYTDFLNYFRGGHTIDDNLDSRQTQESVQYNFLTTALTSGHLVKQGNPLRALQQGYFLVDIFLTEKGAASIPREDQERQFCQIAVELAKKSIPEDGEPHPFVGAVIVKDGIVIATGFRGESGKGGDHGEFCAIKKLSPENPDKADSDWLHCVHDARTLFHKKTGQDTLRRSPDKCQGCTSSVRLGRQRRNCFRPHSTARSANPRWHFPARFD